MSDVNANIGIHFDTNDALAQLRRLQAGLSKFNQSLTQGNIAAENAQKGLNDQLMQSINATGKFVASQKNVLSSTASFTDALEKNKLSMGQYFKFTAAAATANTKVFKNAFASEREIINRARKDRVKALQTQYVQLTNANGELVKVLQVVPKHLKMVNGEYTDYATRTQMAAQRQQLLNQLLKQGSTQLLNFGKNTQWAGRQLMVGFTVPLTMLGSVAAKAFQEMEEAVLKFTRVYGDMTTSVSDTDEAIKGIQSLAKEFTKYGVAAAETVKMAADAAAMGLTGSDLTAQVTAATKLAVLGQVEQQEALETTISLQNAFGISADQLAQKINFLNAVENQTVLSIADLTTAIPKAGPVVKQLGGSVEDLAFFMTAMKEGGINASEGANALKSGLASLINPSKKSSEMLAGLGINIKGLVDANAGDLKGTVVGFARALDTLAPLDRARAIETMFGKFQFARLSTLFQNITKDSSQAARALGLAGASVEELAILSERELGKVEDSVGVKFKKQMENLKLQLVPIGKAFLQAVTPIVKFASSVLEKFNNLSEGTKKFVVGMIGFLGLIAPAALMTFGLLANGVANLIKFFAMLRGGMAKLNGQNNVLGGGFDYLTQQEIENLAQSQALHTSHKELISTFNVEAASVNALAAAYQNAASQARALASGSPGLFNTAPGPKGAVSGLPKFGNGGVVPGTGNKDTVAAMLTPGEVVLTKDTVKNNPELVAALQNDGVKKYNGGTGGGSKSIASRLMTKFVDEGDGSAAFKSRIKGLIEGAMSETHTGLARVIRFAKEAGVEITAEQKDAIEYWRQQMLKAVEEAGDSLVNQIGLTRTQIKNEFKKMSPIPGTQAEGARNTFDLIDTHGNQNQSATYGHLTEAVRMSGSEVREKLNPKSKQSAEILANDMAAEYLNNLPDSDPRKPKTPIVPEYNVVSGLGIDGMTQETNTLLKNGTKNAEEFVDELSNLDPIKAWDTLMKQNGLTLQEHGQDVEALHRKLIALVTELKKTKAEISDADVTEAISGLGSDPEISPAIKNALAKSENKITAARISGVSSEDGQNMQDVVRSGEVVVPGLKDPKNFKIAKSGSAQGGESTSNRVAGIGVFSKELDAELTRAEVEIAETQSPSKRTKRLGINIGEGLRIGLEQKTNEVKSQADKLAEAGIPKVDEANKAKYDALKADPNQRQIQKSIDRHYRDQYGATKVPVPQASSSAETSVTVDIDPQKLAADAIAANAARKKAKELNKKASEAEAAAADMRIKAAQWEEISAKSGGNNMYANDNVAQLKKQADQAELIAAQLRIEAAEEQAKASAKSKKKGNTKDAVASVKSAAREAGKTKKAQEQVTTATEDVALEQIKHGNEVKKARKKAKKSADASGDVLVAEQDVARNTNLTSTASQTVAQNTITAAELTQATETALGDSANNNQQIVRAEDDRVKSAEEIAKLENDIEEQKRRLKEEGMRAVALQQQQNSIIPAGAQTNNNFVNPATAMGYEDAYNLAGDYTKDKKGRLLFDPETGEPTTLSKKQLIKKSRGMRREKVSKVSGKISGGLGTAAMVAGMAGAPPQVTAALGTAATVAQFAPALAGMGPVGWAAAGIMAVGAGAYALNKHFGDMAKAAAQFVTETSATRESMKSVGEVTGKVGASQIMDRRRQGSQYTKYNESYNPPDKFGKQFMSSDVGKQTKKSFRENIKQFGEQKAVDDLALKLATQVADGVLTGAQAESISQALALSLKKQNIEFQVTGQIRTLLGPNGENLEKDPVKTRLNLLANARIRSEKRLTDLDDPDKGGSERRKNAAALAALNINNIELASILADQVTIEFETQKKKLEVELASTTNLQEKIRLQKELDALTGDSIVAETTMNNEILAQLARAQSDFEKVYSSRRFSGTEDAYFDASRNTVEKAYKGTDQEGAAKNFLNRTESFSASRLDGFSTDKQAQSFQVKMEMLVGSKVLTPSEANSMLTMFRGKLGELDQLINISLKEKGPERTKELFGMFSEFRNKKVSSELVSYIILNKKDPAAFDSMMESLANIKSLDGKTIDMQILLKGGAAVAEELERRQNVLEKLKIDTEESDKKSGKKKRTDEDADKLLADAKVVSPEMKQAIESLELNADKMKEFRKGTLDDQIEYLQDLAIGNASENQITQEKIDQEAQYFATRQMMTREDLRLLQQGTDEYIEARKKLVNAYKSKTAGQRAEFNLDFVPKPEITSKNGTGETEVGTKERDTTYDELLKRLRNVRLASINAAGGINELRRALAKTGVKAINDQFRGLEQQLIKTGKAGQFVDYLAGLDQTELNKFGKAATKDGIDPITGKKKKGVKKGDFVLNDKGKLMEAGFNKAILGDYNKAQLQSVQLNKQEIAARNKLVALGYNQEDIQTMLADENYRTLIATEKITSEELKQNAALTAQARIRSKISALLKTGQDAQKSVDNAKRIPEVVNMMREAGVSAEGIREAISNPETLDQLITGMDNFAKLSEDAKNDFKQGLEYINQIPDNKIIKLVFEQTNAQKQIAGANAANELFDMYKTIDENTLESAEGKTFAALQAEMDAINNQAKIAQNAINSTQAEIEGLQFTVDAMQRDIETRFTRPIEQKQRAIEKLNRAAEINFVRPIQALQDRSNVLSHDLEVMNHAAEQINEKYDEQQEALSKVAQINQQIIQQQQQQLGLADALTQGDIAAAARAAQEMRATSAANYAENADKALQQSRQNEIDALRGGVSGKSQKDIQEEQYQNGLKIYDLEQGKAKTDKEVLTIQDEIYALEQGRLEAQDAVQVKMDEISKIQFGTLLDQQKALKVITDSLLPLQAQSDILFAQIATNDKNRTIQEKTRAEWEAIRVAADASEKIASGDLATALGLADSTSASIKSSWNDIRSAYDAIVDKSVQITQRVVTEYGPGASIPGSEDSPVEQYSIAEEIENEIRKRYGGATITDSIKTQIDKEVQEQIEALATEAGSISNFTEAGVLNKLNAMGFMSSGGIVPKYFANGGFAIGTDTVPAMLTPGEFVMSRYAVNNTGLDKMKAINSGAQVGETVYNYSLTVNAKSDASPDDIARTVMAQIKQIDSQKIRGNRF